MIISVNKQTINLIKDETLVEKSNDTYPVQFTFDETWDGFAKTVFFQAGDYQEEVELINDSCDIPSACLDTPGVMLKIRVNGTKNDEEYSTSWGNIGRILYAPFIDIYQHNMINGYYYEGVFYKNPSHTKLIVPVEGKLYYDLTEKKLYEFNGEVYVLVGGFGAFAHDNLPNRNLPDQHPISSITGLAEIIPEQANEDNLLADKGFVTKSIVANTPHYISNDGEPFFDVLDLPNRTKRWSSVAYGNGKFVAIAKHSDKGAYSTDGINWTETTMPSDVYWYSVAYGDGKFVAVAEDSIVAAYSTDGINWTETTMPSSEPWFSVAYGNGKFVAVAYGSDVAAYSTDGINWIETTMPSSDLWSSVAYGNGKFVAIADESDVAAYSSDGINWTETTMPSDEYWLSVAYGNGKFVAVVYDSDKGAYSTDGINWTETTMPSDEYWSFVAYGNGKFVAVIDESDVAAYSTDGINWTETTMPSDAYWYSVAYGDGKFVAVAEYNIVAAYSTDGINWTETTMPSDIQNNDYAYVVRYENDGNRSFIYCRYNSEYDEWSQEYRVSAMYFESDQMAAINSGVTSEVVETVNDIAPLVRDRMTYGNVPIPGDLPTAIKATMPSSAPWMSIAYGDGKFVAIAEYSDKGAYSTDDINWTETTMPSDVDWFSVTYGDGKFVAIARESIVAAYSTDGINWTETTMPSDEYWLSVAYGNGKFVAIADESDVAAYSTDGINWIETTMPSSASWNSVTYGDGKFVAITPRNMAAYSTDGINWIETTMPSSASWNSVTYGDGKFVAITPRNMAAYSTDGINWTETTMPGTLVIGLWWTSVAYGDGKFVAVDNDKNLAAYSADGINWTETTMPSSAPWMSIAYGNGKFVAISSSSNNCAYFVTGRPGLIQNETDVTPQVSKVVEQNLTRFTLSTTAPVADISDGGIHIVFLTEEPATKYNGYIYLIEEV